MIELRQMIYQELSHYGWSPITDYDFFTLGHPEKPYILAIHISYIKVRIFVRATDVWISDGLGQVDNEIVVSKPRDILTLNDKVENIIM